MPHGYAYRCDVAVHRPCFLVPGSQFLLFRSTSYVPRSTSSPIPMLLARPLLALTLLAPAVSAQSPVCAAEGVVRPGLEVLLADSLHLVRGKRVGLVTNHTGLDRCGRRAVDRLVAT